MCMEISPNHDNQYPTERWFREELIAEVDYLHRCVQRLLDAESRAWDAYNRLEERYRKLKDRHCPGKTTYRNHKNRA